MSDPIKTLHDSVMASHAVSNYLSVLLQKFKDAVLHCHERIQKLEANDNCEVCQYAVLTSNKVDDLAERVERLGRNLADHEQTIGKLEETLKSQGDLLVWLCREPDDPKVKKVKGATKGPSESCTCGGPAWLPRETDSEGKAQLCCEECGKQKAGDEELYRKFDNLIGSKLDTLMVYASRYGAGSRQADITKEDILRDLIRDARGQD